MSEDLTAESSRRHLNHVAIGSELTLATRNKCGDNSGGMAFLVTAVKRQRYFMSALPSIADIGESSSPLCRKKAT
jgi:hypothetical protein